VVLILECDTLFHGEISYRGRGWYCICSGLGCFVIMENIFSINPQPFPQLVDNFTSDIIPFQCIKMSLPSMTPTFYNELESDCFTSTKINFEWDQHQQKLFPSFRQKSAQFHAYFC
jgi:hypothetical protein